MIRNLMQRIIPDAVKPIARFIERMGIRLSRAVFPPRLPRNPGNRVYVNLGCGPVTHPASINVDAMAAWHIHYIRPIDDLRPFPNESVDLVYASHCLEHFGHREVNRVLAEWRRVLKPGGILRLGVPDFDRLAAIYAHAGRNIEAIQDYLMGGQTYPLNAHHAAFTQESLTTRLRAVGFAEVRMWHRGTDELTSLPDCTGMVFEHAGCRFPISLNLEAVK